MYTQFHVDTRVGRVVAHRLADEPLRRLEVGLPVSSSAGRPSTRRVLADDAPAARRLALERSEPPLGDAPPDLGGHDHDAARR